MFGSLRRLFGGGGASPAGGRPSDGDVLVVDGHRLRVDRSPQVLRLRMEELVVDFPRPRIPEWTAGFVSGAALAYKCKVFDDGLYAAVELAAQRGHGRLPSKRALLDALIDANPGTDVLPLLGAARSFTGRKPAGPQRHEIERAVDDFLEDQLRSRPLGFYTWTPELAALFRQDRCLQQELPSHDAALALARELHRQPELREAYEAQLSLASRLTNPFAEPDLRGLLRAPDAAGGPPASGGARFLPASVSHETELAKRLLGDEPIPGGFNLVEELVRQVRSGYVDLSPHAESGWYDRQTWALEVLIAPERASEAVKLRLDPTYASHLLELAKGLLALSRETHAKQLDVAMVGAAMDRNAPRLVLRPLLTVEPLVTFYERRADGYGFVRDALVGALGEAAVAALRRLTPDGPMRAPLLEELDALAALLRGAAATARAELGLPCDRAAQASFTPDRVLRDPDLERDARMMVPVFFDRGRGKTKAWLFLGWNSRLLSVEFELRPQVELLGPSSARVEYGGAAYQAADPVMVEAYVGRILDREEFRRLCDRHGSIEGLLSALA